MINDGFAGVYPYLVSPVNTDGSVRTEVLKNLIDHLIEKGVHGLTPLGSTGEFAYLTWDQKRDIVRTVVESSNGRVPVVAGVNHTSTREAARQASEFNAMGVDGILAIMDTYFPLSQDEVYSYFRGIADAVSCPVILYTNPSFQKTDLSLELIQRLARVENIQYLKDASGNTGKLLSILQAVGDDLKLFSASASIPLFVLMIGGVGWMAGPACVVPAQSVALYNLAREKRWDEAIVLQKQLWKMNYIFQKYNLASCIKAALEIQGFPVGDPVPPIRPVDGKALEHIRRVLADLETL
jgi:4-hydroxy-tetrahydrodipicolinate synthase